MNRIYKVTNRDTGADHLIRASSQAQAVRHAARNQFSIEVASQDQLVELVSMGVAVEDAAGDEAPTPKSDLVDQMVAHVESLIPPSGAAQ